MAVFSNPNANRRRMLPMHQLAMTEQYCLVVGTISQFVSTILLMLVTYRTGRTIDSLTSHSIPPSDLSEIVGTACFYICGAFVFHGGLSFIYYYCMDGAVDRVRDRILARLFYSLIGKRIPFFDQTSSGTLVNLLNDDSRMLAYSLTRNVAEGLKSLFVITMGLYFMYSMSPMLLMMSLLVVPPFTVAVGFIGLRMKRARSEAQERIAAAMSYAQERISNIETIRAFSKEKKEVRDFLGCLDQILASREKVNQAHGLFHFVVELSTGLMAGLIVYFGASMLYAGTVTAGTLAAFLNYARMVAGSMKSFGIVYTSFMNGLSSFQRIQNVMEQPDEDSCSTGIIQPITASHNSIRFHSVSFTYPSRPDMPVLKNVTLDIPGGKVTAIFGSSGAGKSTLAALILRLYDLKEGNGYIKIGASNIQQICPQDLRKQIGYVPQDPALFSGTVRENILYGLEEEGTLLKEGDREALLHRAAQDSNALEFIIRLPQKFDSQVGEKGMLLSGGQRQRVVIARALIKNPDILIFDEPTSSLDSENEMLIQEALERVKSNRTVIIIAHRLSTIRNADQIALISDGTLAELGTYKDLMSIPFGKFKKLVERRQI